MKNIDKKKLAIIFVAVLAIIGIIMLLVSNSCSSKRVKQIYFAKESETINSGGSKTLQLYNDDVYKVVWKSSDEDIAIVDSNGEVYAKKTGTVTITATTSDKQQKVAITINVKETENTVQKIDVSGEKTSTGAATMSLTVNETKAISYSIEPKNVDNAEIAWKSRNTKVAKVSADGKITGVKVGKTTIVGTAKDGSGTNVQIVVNVTSEVFKITSLKFGKTSLNMKIGSTTKLSASISPSKASNKELTWTSSNASVASVDDKGKITANKLGTTIINAKTKDGSNLTATCVVTVSTTGDTSSGSGNGSGSGSGSTKVKAKVSSISLSHSNVLLGLDDSRIKVTATVNPSDAANKSLTWTSSNTSVATVSSGYITPKGIGTAIITVAAKDGSGVTNKINVTVKKLSDNKKYVESISLDKNNFQIADTAKSVSINAILNPSNADNTKVKWTSSNTSVATVSNTSSTKGSISIKGTGTTTITVTSQDRNAVSTSTTLTVVKGVTKVSLNQTLLSLVTQTQEQLIAKVSPADAANQSVSWTSSNTEIALVDQNGTVTGISSGSATITATAKDGSGNKATCRVTVKNPVPIKTIKLTADNDEIVAGFPTTIRATISPSNAANKKLLWTSSNSNIATVDQEGHVTATGVGQVTITATAKDGSNVEASIVIVVSPQYVTTSVKLSALSTDICVNHPMQIQAVIEPLLATPTAGLNWKTSNVKVANVSGKGYVTAVDTLKSKSTVTITATATDTKKKPKSGKIKLTAYPDKAASVIVDIPSITLYVTNKTNLKENEYNKTYNMNNDLVTVKPDCATDRSFTWTSSKPTIVSVNGSTITAIKKGTSSICAVANSNNKVKKCFTVTVKNS